ncbi:MAG: serine/threonine protein kinase [Candidatus Obscuribacterales bacterium]|nr:serine/threonine protein kinase [Candidatus Obscuribacterales bacterium]
MGRLKAGFILDRRYEILEPLGQGGMGEIYKAKELDLERTVAIKLLHLSSSYDEDSLARFKQEAKILANLQHRNILTFYRLGEWENCPYIAMEFIEGRSLKSLLNTEGKLAPERCLRIFNQLCDALSYAHQRGIIHRDLSSANIMLSNEGKEETAKLIDFGLARLAEGAMIENQQQTKTGLLLGSVNYMSPEQCRGQKPDQRSDIYALAVCLYEALSGELPFQAENPIAVMHLHTSQTAPHLPKSVEDPDARLDNSIQKGMAKEANARFQKIEELAESLNGATCPPQKPSQNKSYVKLLLASALLIICGLLFAGFTRMRSELHLQAKKIGKTNKIPRGLNAQLRVLSQTECGTEGRFTIAKLAMKQLQQSKEYCSPQQLVLVSNALADEQHKQNLIEDEIRTRKIALALAKKNKHPQEYLAENETRLAQVLVDNAQKLEEARRLLEDSLKGSDKDSKKEKLTERELLLARALINLNLREEAQKYLKDVYESTNGNFVDRAAALISMRQLEGPTIDREREDELYHQFQELGNQTSDYDRLVRAFIQFSSVSSKHELLIEHLTEWQKILSRCNESAREKYYRNLCSAYLRKHEAQKAYAILLAEMKAPALKADLNWRFIELNCLMMLKDFEKSAQKAKELKDEKISNPSDKAQAIAYYLQSLLLINNFEQARKDLPEFSNYCYKNRNGISPEHIFNLHMLLVNVASDKLQIDICANTTRSCRLTLEAQGSRNLALTCCLTEAVQLARERKFNEELKLLKQYFLEAQSATESPEIQVFYFSELGRCLAVLGKSSSEAKEIESYLSRAPHYKNRSQVYVNAAHYYASLGEEQAAQQNYMNALKEAKTSTALCKIGLSFANHLNNQLQVNKVFELTKRLKPVCESLDKRSKSALDLPTELELIKLIALSYLSRKNCPAAIDELRKLSPNIENKDRRLSVRLHIVQLLIDEDRYEEALKELKELKNEHPTLACQLEMEAFTSLIKHLRKKPEADYQSPEIQRIIGKFKTLNYCNSGPCSELFLLSVKIAEQRKRKDEALQLLKDYRDQIRYCKGPHSSGKWDALIEIYQKTSSYDELIKGSKIQTHLEMSKSFSPAEISELNSACAKFSRSGIRK